MWVVFSQCYQKSDMDIDTRNAIEQNRQSVVCDLCDLKWCSVAAQYSVTCQCGQTVSVKGGDAGCQMPCVCGHFVEVPNLRDLRSAVGESTASPELIINALLLDGLVPGEASCISCGASTEDVSYVSVVCERPESQSGAWRFNPFLLLFGMISFHREEASDRGRNVAYQLPVRVCRLCARRLTRSGTSSVLKKIEVYRQLLVKYPHASVGRPTNVK